MEVKSAIVEFYRIAKEWVTENSDWIDTVGWDDDPDDHGETDFLESGYKARYLQPEWPDLNRAWRGFQPSLIEDAARDEALSIIGHKGKANAVLKTARMIRGLGWSAFRASRVQSSDTLYGLPWIKEANSLFLARHLRLQNVAKPDTTRSDSDGLVSTSASWARRSSHSAARGASPGSSVRRHWTHARCTAPDRVAG